MATYGLSMSQSWCSGAFDVSHSTSGRNATITVTLRLWRNDGGRSWNWSASNNFYINISGNIARFTIQEITGGGISVSHSASFGTDNNGNVSVGVEVGGSLSGTTFAIVGGNGTTYTATGAQKASWTVRFDANGGSGAPGNQTKVYGSILTLSSTKPTRLGYEFLGWGTSPGDTTPDYQPGGKYGADADITLYAIWQILELIEFNINTASLTIPSDTAGNARIPSLSIPFTVVYTENNYTLPFYYRVCAVDNSSGTVLDPEANSGGILHGPFTANDIMDGGGESDAFSIPISSDIIKTSLLNCNSETQVKFLVQISNTNDQFSEVLTTEHLITVNILNFCFLSMKINELYRSTDDDVYDAKLSVDVQFPKSYYSNAMTLNGVKNPTITINNSISPSTATALKKSVDNTHSIISYTIGIISSALSDAGSDKIALTITDGISTASAITRLGASGDGEGIYFCNDNTVEAVEFIEDDYTGFKKGGRVVAQEIIENDEGVFIGDELICKEIIEV